MTKQFDVIAELRAIKAESKNHKGFAGAAALMHRVRALRSYQLVCSVSDEENVSDQFETASETPPPTSEEIGMKQTKPLTTTQPESDPLTIDASAFTAQMGVNQFPPEMCALTSSDMMSALNGRQTEMNTLRVESDPIVAEFLESVKTGDSEPGWVN